MEKQTGTEGATNHESGDAAPQTQPTNREIKDSDLFQKLTGQLAEANAKIDAWEKAESAAKVEAERKALEEKGLYEEAIKSRDAELEKIKAEHAKQILDRDIKGELLKAGFNNDTFLAGSVATYDAESDGTPSEYAAKLAGDEANAAFLAKSGREPKPSTGKVVANGPSGNQELTLEQLRDMKKSDAEGGSREKRLERASYLERYFKQNGAFPEGLTN